MINPFHSPTFGNSLSLRVDGAIGAMSLSPNGRDAVLAGRKGLFIIDLDDPFLAPRWLHHITSWEVADVQWYPHHTVRPSWCVSTSNQKALLWDLARPSNNAIQNVLHRHVRAITDINFHPQDPELLATCSIDTFVYCWDMRSPRRPVAKWAEWRAGATQVKWNRINPYQIASSHHHSFYIWDSRMGALPLLKIEDAHEGKINGLDFNSNENRLISCSNDKTIKIWDLDNYSESSLEPTVVINAQFPVARARSLPFGDDGCCGIMPLRGGSNAIHFINYSEAYKSSQDASKIVEIDLKSEVLFKGHQGPVKDFLWRVQHERYTNFEKKENWKEYQLVTWSPTDFDLKLWPQEKKLHEMANYNPRHKRDIESLTKLRAKNFSTTNDTSFSVDNVKAIPLEYNSYITEPESSLADILKCANDDLLSRLALFEINKVQEQETSSDRLNHLNWIFGVRMGPKLTSDNLNSTSESARNDGPAYLGEEISIVGHKFPKIRFEKISVSTGQIILSLRGPIPPIKKPNEQAPQEARNGDDQSTSNNADKSVSAHLANDSSLPKGLVKTSEADDVNTCQTEPSVTRVSETNNDSKLIFIRVEFRFPKQYPHLKHSESTSKLKRTAKQKRSSGILFKIEETHELNADIKNVMLENLTEISQFYTVKYNRYCLEPCLRYLLGDRIDLNDALMLSNDMRLDKEFKHIDEKSEELENPLNDLPTAGMDLNAANLTAKSTILGVQKGNDSPSFNKNDNVDGEDDDIYHDADLIAGADDDLAVGSELFENIESNPPDVRATKFRDITHNITPLPKACSALWTSSGQLVCFFAFNSGNELKKGNPRIDSAKYAPVMSPEMILGEYKPSTFLSLQKDFESVCEKQENGSDAHYYTDDSDTSLNSSSDYSEDWDEVFREDLHAYRSIPTVLKEAIVLRHSRIPGSSRISHNRSGKGTASLSSYVEDSILLSTRRNKGGYSGKHYVRVHDFSHLIPDKPALAREYQLTGPSLRDIARHNGEVALNNRIKDVAEAWRIVELILASTGKTAHLSDINGSIQSTIDGWGNHPFGHAWLVRVLFDYFEKQNNLQMLAMISCVLHVVESEVDHVDQNNQIKPSLSQISGQEKEKEFKISRESISTHENVMSIEGDAVSRVNQSNARQSRHSKSIAHSNERKLLPKIFNSLRKTPDFSYMPIVPPTSASGTRAVGDKKLMDTQHRISKKPMVNRIGNIIGKSSSNLCARREKAKSEVSVSVIMMNIEEQDSRAGPRKLTLLRSVDSKTVSEYRERYAELLYSWGQPYERIQMLKFNSSLDQANMSPLKGPDYACNYRVRNRRFLDKSQELLTPFSLIEMATVNPWNTIKRSTIIYCSLCNQIASRRILFCLDCEHILHFGCAADWWSAKETALDASCPTGCGCACATSQSIIKDTRYS